MEYPMIKARGVSLGLLLVCMKILLPAKREKNFECIVLQMRLFVGKADITLMDGDVKRNLLQLSVCQFLLHKVFDDTGNTDTDLGKLDQKIHIGDLDIVLGLDLVPGEVIVNVLTGHIIFIKEH